MKQLVQNMRDGHTKVVDAPVPSPKPGCVLVKTAASLVSAGTERNLVEFAQKSLLGKAQSRPDLMQQVMDKAKREGIVPTIESAFNRLDQPMPLGYSLAGVVVELGEGVSEFRVGQAVVCAGANARHAEYVSVEKNLVAALPEGVHFDSAAFSTLGAIAIHGFRQAEPQLGESIAVIGLGLLGLLTAAIAKNAGFEVLGIDLDPRRIELARAMGIKAVLRLGAEEAVLSATQSKGADISLICAATKGNDPIELAADITRDRGRIISLGVVGLNLPFRKFYNKELEFKVSRSYGPGRYDPAYEEGGQDYPYSYVRWTAGRNLGAFAQLLADGLDISSLITHRFPIEEASKAYEMITSPGEEFYLGILLKYPQEPAGKLAELKKITISPPSPSKTVNLGVLGAGLFANAVMLPAIKKVKDIHLVGIATASGASAQQAASRHGFQYASSDVAGLVQDKAINTLAILTRHHQHAEQALAGLEAGKHVFVEKPLAISEIDLAKIETALAQPGAPLLTVGFNRRFAPMVIKMKEFLAGSTEPLLINYRINAGFLPGEHWQQDLVQGGGRILGEGCHFIDLVSYLIGEIPSAVSTVGMQDKGKYHEDNVIISLEYPGGSVASVSYLANGDKSFSKERIEAYSAGHIAVLDNFQRLDCIYKGRKSVTRSNFKLNKGHQAEWEQFSQAIQAGGPPPIPYSEIFGVHRATLAALHALRTKTRVEL